jgi:hypothetical protein
MYIRGAACTHAGVHRNVESTCHAPLVEMIRCTASFVPGCKLACDNVRKFASLKELALLLHLRTAGATQHWQCWAIITLKSVLRTAEITPWECSAMLWPPVVSASTTAQSVGNRDPVAEVEAASGLVKDISLHVAYQ